MSDEKDPRVNLLTSRLFRLCNLIQGPDSQLVLPDDIYRWYEREKAKRKDRHEKVRERALAKLTPEELEALQGYKY